jgi:hypothetical protein
LLQFAGPAPHYSEISAELAELLRACKLHFGKVMLDLTFVAGTLAFFAIAIAYVRGCARL